LGVGENRKEKKRKKRRKKKIEKGGEKQTNCGEMYQPQKEPAAKKAGKVSGGKTAQLPPNTEARLKRC